MLRLRCQQSQKVFSFFSLAPSGQSDGASFTGCRLWAVVTGRGLIPKHSIEIYCHGWSGLLQRLALHS